MSDKLYNENSIESLTPLQFTRLKPGVYCGDTTYSTQLVIEILSNSIDEFNLGHGNLIKIKCDNKNKIYSVEDNGQGFIPNSFREDGKTILEAAFSVLNTSGKYKEDGTYEGTSLGSFGIGSKLIVFLSHSANVITYRDNKYEEIYFKEGIFEKRKTGDIKENKTGTIVTWNPSEEFFTNAEIDMKALTNLLETIVCLCPGLTIELDNDGQQQSFYAKQGLNDYVDKNLKDKEICKNRLIVDFEVGKNKMNGVLTYSNSYSSTIIPYVNTGLTESGNHITILKTCITRELNKFFKEKGWLKEKDNNFSGEDVQEGLYFIFNLTSAGVSYDAQVKSRIVNINMKDFVVGFSEAFSFWLQQNEKDIKLIFDKAIKAREAKEAAKKAREAVRKPKKRERGLRAKIALSDKFIDCVSRDAQERNLLLVEGLSAAGSTLEARNVNTDCIYMLRGKIVSSLKTPIDKLLANQEISDIIKIIGAGFGSEFDVNKMNFNKIVITSDQDSDGAAIELLLITFFFTYMRELVEQGKLYRAVTPLYIITKGKEKYYCYSEQELTDWKENNKNKQYSLTHCKGLGEVSAKVLKEICFEKQRYKRITVSDAQKTSELLEVLEGKAITPRKQYIYDNATTLGFNFM